MLWREGYAPKFRPDAVAPVLTGTTLAGEADSWTGPTIAVTSLGALATVGLWTRLFRSEALPFRVAGIGPSARELRDFFPPSDRSWVVIPVDPEEWRAFLPESAAETTVAVVRCGLPGFLLVGPPTEDAWERFVNEIRVTTSDVA